MCFFFFSILGKKNPFNKGKCSLFLNALKLRHGTFFILEKNNGFCSYKITIQINSVGNDSREALLVKTKNYINKRPIQLPCRLRCIAASASGHLHPVVGTVLEGNIIFLHMSAFSFVLF